MSNIFLLADAHFGHENIIKVRPFSTIEEHDEVILDNIKTVVCKRDVIYFVGDICVSKKSLEYIKSINCLKKMLIIGNHDIGFREKITLNDLIETYDDVVAMFKKQNYAITHIPVHEGSIRCKYNIHGHLHDKVIDNPRYFSVSCERINYTPVKLTTINDYYKEINI